MLCPCSPLPFPRVNVFPLLNRPCRNCKRPSSLPLSRPFIPMAWGATYAQDTALMSQLSVLGQPGIEDTLLGFNEPDFSFQVSGPGC